MAGTGRRLVAFTLSVTQASDNSGLLNAPTGVTAALKFGASSTPISMSAIDQQIAGGSSGTAQTTGTDSFVASVPARAHDVALVAVRRTASASRSTCGPSSASPRAPPSSTATRRRRRVTGTAAGPFHVSFTNPADGYSSSDDAQVQSASLTYFAPGASGTTPGTPDQAFLVLGLQSSYPSIPYGQPDSGHFFSGFTPLAGNRLTFTPTRRLGRQRRLEHQRLLLDQRRQRRRRHLRRPLLLHRAGERRPAGTLSVLPGTASGTEYTGFTGTGNAVPITVSGPANTTLSFPAVPAPAPAQKTPPWVGAPLPATGLAAAPATGSGDASPSSGGGGFPSGSWW